MYLTSLGPGKIYGEILASAHKHTKLHIIKLSKLTSRLYASLIRKLRPTCRQLRTAVLHQLGGKAASEQFAHSDPMRP